MCVLDIQMSLMEVLKALGRTLKRCSREFLTSTISGFCHVIEAIAYPWNSQDELQSLRYEFYFLAQLGHVNMKAVCSSVRLVSPDFFQEHLPREDFAPVDDERLEQVELGRGQRDFLLTEFNMPPREIDGERTLSLIHI